MSLEGVGDICLEWIDNDGKDHKYIIENVMFCPNSPVNLLGITKFGKQLDKDLSIKMLSENTSIIMYPNHSVFI